jgi:hypothetical protein
MKIGKILVAVFILAVVVWLLADLIDKRKKKKELLSSFKISVIEIDDSITPGLIVEVENKGENIISTTHFRLRFNVEDKTLCGVDYDAGNFIPNEKRRIVLRCREQIIWTVRPISYFLSVFPEGYKGIEPLSGEFTLR